MVAVTSHLAVVVVLVVVVDVVLVVVVLVAVVVVDVVVVEGRGVGRAGRRSGRART